MRRVTHWGCWVLPFECPLRSFLADGMLLPTPPASPRQQPEGETIGSIPGDLYRRREGKGSGSPVEAERNISTPVTSARPPLPLPIVPPHPVSVVRAPTAAARHVLARMEREKVRLILMGRRARLAPAVHYPSEHGRTTPQTRRGA